MEEHPHKRRRTKAWSGSLARAAAGLRPLVAASLVAALLAASLPPEAMAQSAAPQATAADVATSTVPVEPTRSSKQRTKDAQAADDAYLEGARLLQRKDVAGAQREFERASALMPGNHDYRMAAAAMRESRVTALVQQAGKDRLLGKDAEAEQLLAEARTLDPANALVTEHAVPASWKDLARQDVHSWITEGPRLAGPIALTPKPGRLSFHIHSDLRDAIRNVASSFGLKASFDESIQPLQVKFDLDDVTYDQAMHVLLEMGTDFAVPLDADSVLFAKDTTENRTRLEHMVQETLYLPGLTTSQLAEMGNMIRQVFEIKQLSVANAFNTIVVRAPAEPIRVLNLTLADLLDGGSEVVFELKIYTIDKSNTTNVGVTVPNQIGAYNAASAATQLVQANQSVVNEAIAEGVIPANLSNIDIAAALLYYGLATSSQLTNTIAFLGGGLTTTGLYSSDLSAQLNLALNTSDSRALDDIKLRVGDRQSATFQVGEKYPITQSTYSTTTPTTATGLSGATIGGVSVSSLLNSAATATVPQIQYEDIGLTLKATPTVQKSGKISLHLDLKIESLQGASLDNIPVLNATQMISDVTVPDGGTATLVSNLNRNESAAVTGVPGLSDLPGFQSAPDLLRTTDEGQLVMQLIPHLVRRRPNASAGPRIPISLPATVE